MKYIFLLLTLVSFSISANCQLDKKYWLVGGSGSFYTYNEKSINTVTNMPVSGKLTEINLSGNVGYFLFDKFVAGVRPGITSIKSRGLNTASAGTKSVALFIGPFARYYFLNKEKPFNILIDGTYQFGSYSNYDERKGSITNISIMTGPEIFFNTSVGIELLFGYLYQKKSIDKTQSGFFFNNVKSGFNVSIGIQVHLKKKSS
jgi:hypothetical protein